MMTEWLARGFASLGIVAGAMLTAGIPGDVNSWSVFIDKFGVLAFVIVCAVGGIIFIAPRIIDIISKYLERQDARQEKMREEFMRALERRDETQGKMTAAIENLTDRIDNLK